MKDAPAFCPVCGEPVPGEGAADHCILLVRTDKRIKRAIRGLMVADNLGDVCDYVNVLRNAVGLPPCEGNYLDGWTDRDWEGVEDSRDW